jgi:aspartyl-tRNA(Asn)/glutamyl-tRNA(Gln) amidotransferase subunit C
MVNEDDLKKIANLARLEIEPSLISPIVSQLNNILSYVERLNQIDTTNVEPLCHVHGSTNVFREDRVVVGLDDSNPPVSGTLTLEETLSNAPEKSGRFFKVPLVIE